MKQPSNYAVGMFVVLVDIAVLVITFYRHGSVSVGVICVCLLLCLSGGFYLFLRRNRG